MSMRVRMPKYILLGMNRCIIVKSPTRSDKQGTLMYSHYLLVRELSIKACKPQGTWNTSSLNPIWFVRVDGTILVRRQDLMDTPSSNASIK